ncbi:hypothetical protein [Nocardia arizonensis]|uniref:hypothetical protein n=1 Tax=Nocardia arizonensis TaxID=1141647 RepID=UPI0006D008DF|nr:hypothetical protein [Nocardia arizonensis]
MSETVIRHRGGGHDDDGNPVPWGDTAIAVQAIAPGATAEYVDRGRDGDRVEFTIYATPAVDITDADEVTVRGQRCRVQVEDWRSPRTTRTGTVVLCTRGRG